LAVDASNNLYLFTENGGATGADPANTLYKRTATTGLWQSFEVNTSSTWTSPAIAVQGSSKLFLLGINLATNEGEYKSVAIGQENLAASASTNPLFTDNGNPFADLSAPFNLVDGTTQLMVTVENSEAGKIWFNHVALSGGGIGGGCPPVAAAGPAVIPGTKGGSSELYKPNQNKLFYHGGFWWAAAPEAATKQWHLWQYVSSSWIKAKLLDARPAARPDFQLDAAANKLYILLANSSSSGTQFQRWTFNPALGTWSTDLGFPVALSGFSYQGENPTVLTRAKNGELWVFGPRVGVLYARRSADGGQTWTGDIILKTLGVPLGISDAVAFTSSGKNYVGVGYAEDTDPTAGYGFLMHKDGDADNVWTDESSQLITPVNTVGDDHIAMAVSASNEVFMVIKTNPSKTSAAGVNLYKRAANGTWSSFTAFTTSAETRPAVVIDDSNNELYIFTTLLGSPRVGRYKKCTIGNEASLVSSPYITFFQNALDDFYNVSTPAHRVNSCTGLMVLAENNTGKQSWFQLFSISGNGPPLPTAPVVGAITVAPTAVSEAASYTIPITLGATNGLIAGNTITITWPLGTTIPAVIANANVTVNGVAATGVITTPLTRQAIVTAPANIAGGATATVIFNTAAGVINPALAGATYTINAQTSAQPLDGISPPYTITAGLVTPVLVGTVIVAPDTATRAASYTIPITLGATGALTAGLGTITVTWPADSNIPATIANTNATVNGVNANAVIANAVTRQATVTVPANLLANAAVTLVFKTTAGIKNPTIAGTAYTLQVLTSAQPLNANSPAYTIKALAGTPPPSASAAATLSWETKAAFDKSSQSKVFYVGGQWWTVAQDSANKQAWFFWKYSAGVWTKGLKYDSRAGSRADIAVEAATNKVYMISSQGTNTYFYRFLNAGGNMTLEAQITVPAFDHGDGANVVTLARGKNGHLWAFRIFNFAVETSTSIDDGNTWSLPVQIKTGLTSKYGQTDAVTFSASGNYVGVFYGLRAASGGMQFGFLKHLDGDPSTTWTEETSQLTFFGSETADEYVSANAGNDGSVYVMTRNKAGISGVDPTNTLYKRVPQGGSGAWSKFKVNVSTTWTSPTLAIDGSGNRLFVMGIRMDAPNIGEYKVCAIGSEGSLQNALATVMFKSALGTDNFGHLSAPLAPVTNSTGLMLVASNLTKDDLWFNNLNLSLTKNAEVEAAELARQREAEIETFSEVQVYPNPFNPATTIRFALHEAAPVKLLIYNIRGEVVRTLVNGEMSRGLYEQRWNGRDHTGKLAASGLYFYRLQIGAKLHHGRMQLVK